MNKIKISDMIKFIVIIGSIISAVLFMEDRLSNKAQAIEKEAVKTLEAQQQVYSEQQKTLEYKLDRARLDDLKTDKVILEKELKRDPENELLKDKLDMVNKMIIKLENKLYGE